MERPYPIDYRAYEVEKKMLWIEVFEQEMQELHPSGFANPDIKRPSNLDGLRFDNVANTAWDQVDWYKRFCYQI